MTLLSIEMDFLKRAQYRVNLKLHGSLRRNR
jgi:hypothetical protein